jgi:hypothetical protein
MVKLCIYGSTSLKVTNQQIDDAIYDMFLKDFGNTNQPFDYVDELVCGMAPGVDSWARLYALKCDVEIKPFRANWNKLGLSAGPLRNREMAEYCTHAIGFWNGISRGTANMTTHLVVLGKPVTVIQLP